MFHATIHTAFAASHALRLPDGSLEPLHGHNWNLSVTVGCNDDQLDAIDTVMDFHELERIVAAIIAPFQNSHLNDVAPFSEASDKVNPSAERIAWHIGQAVQAQLTGHAKLQHVKITEAPGCEATYLP